MSQDERELLRSEAALFAVCDGMAGLALCETRFEALDDEWISFHSSEQLRKERLSEVDHRVILQ